LQKLVITQAKKTDERQWLSEVSNIPLRYFLSFVVDVAPTQTDAKNQSVGIDLGIKTFAAMSNGEMVYSPDYSRLSRRIRRKQKRLARQVKDSKRRAKTRLQIAIPA
jgi:putative transposase